MSQDRPESFKDKVHELLRSSILDAAWIRAAEVSWSQVRIADIADDVGVSRQTIYNEFGTKDQLSLALFQRELDRFLLELKVHLGEAATFHEAIGNSMNWMLDEISGHKVLARMVRDARSGSNDGLLPILTVRADFIIVPVREKVTEFALERWPDADRASCEVVIDLFSRFVIGQIITPTDLDREAMVAAMITMATHYTAGQHSS
ncbi:TetR/AcrR family transcriptional regulator [Nocardioides sp. JQ2195]|uniref:TetR/AcrR family transcriptional regulator n=1 Tax=Nocardioides sp. JQ2195 TaxID=2592334 RepID=UPI00143EEEBB|nr:TetR/AcrR family transcriptional regulator [Nocardioides sp. JQ2195]QIX25394.1 TetR/AcrR family transcriptional regulator [Nocardioides sp. JQ2195]